MVFHKYLLLIRDPRSHIHLAGVVSREYDFRWIRRPSLSEYSFEYVRDVLVSRLVSFRLLRTPGQAKTRFLASLSELECFFDVSRYIQK